MTPQLSKQGAICLADEYRKKYIKSTLDYQITQANYQAGGNSFSQDGIWEITYDVRHWDDVWYSIIISDAQIEVLCCCNAWAEKFYPHLKTPRRKQKPTPRQKRLNKAGDGQNSQTTLT